MQHMLAQIMERLAPAAAAAAPSSGDVPAADPDSYMSNALEGGDLDIPNLFS